MTTPVQLPQLELTMESAVIARWRIREGESVTVGQNLVEIETQKAVSEVSAPVAGVVRRICFADGATVSANATLCLLTSHPDEVIEAPSVAPLIVPSQRGSSGSPGSAEEAGAAGMEAVRASPAARKAARDLKVELSRIRGTGPGGRITPEDVVAFAKTGTAAAEWTPLPAARLAFNSQMARTLLEIPQILVNRRMEVSPLLRRSDGVTFTHRLTLAAAGAIRVHPALRTMTDGKRLKVMPCSVAIAMDVGSGLVAPVLREKDLASLETIARRISELRARAANRQLRNQELIDGPFAISNLGMLGVDFFTPLVFHGQTAVLAAGRALQSGEGIFAWCSLAADHRVVDGAEAARFLATLQREIQAL